MVSASFRNENLYFNAKTRWKELDIIKIMIDTDMGGT